MDPRRKGHDSMPINLTEEERTWLNWELRKLRRTTENNQRQNTHPTKDWQYRKTLETIETLLNKINGREDQ